jgi:hyaluronate lyase
MLDNVVFYYADALHGEIEGGNGGTDMNGHLNGNYIWEYADVNTVEGELIERKKTVIADFSSSEFVLASGIADRVSALPGTPTYVYNLGSGSARINLPSAVSIIGTYFVEFDIYSPAATGASVSFSLPGCESTFSVKLDFVGKKTVSVLLSQISVRNPRPAVTAFTVTTASGTGTVYIGNVYAVEDVYKILVPYGVDIKSSEPYDQVIDKFVEYTVGLPSDNSAEMQQKRKSYSDTAKQRWDSFKSTYVDATAPNTLFGLNVKNGGSYANEPVMYLYQYINDMANAYAAYGGEYYKNKELLADILKALEYGYNCAYGVNILAAGQTWGDWYHWDVPIPKSLMQTLALIAEDIDYELILKYLAPFRMICYFPEGLGGNKMLMSYNVLLASALERDAYRFCLAKQLVYDEFFYIDRPEDENVIRIGDGGPYTDGSYVQHGEVAYTGVYGMALVENIAYILSITGGTVLDLDHGKIDIVYEWIFNNYNSVIFEGHYMPSLMGRGIGGVTDTAVTISLTARCITLSVYAPDEWKDKLRSLSKYYMELLPNVDFTQKVPACLIGYCAQLYADDTVELWQPTEHARIFGAMARAFQYGPEYGVNISMSSTRISKYESINGANYVGWYHGDGMIYIYTDGYEYNSVYFNWGNPYLLPGTTVNTAKRYSRNIYPMLMNSSAYAGGTAQGKYAAVGYVLGYDPDKAFASNTYVEKNDTMITARKSYFLFDNEIVCVGSGINDFSNDRVLTVVENRYWREGDVLYIDGVQMNAPATVQTEISARTMHFTNMGGYVFLDSDGNYDGATVKYQKATHGVYEYYDTAPGSTARPKENFLEIVIDHGVGDGNVEADKYVYAYLPESTVAETEAYFQDPDVALLAHRTSVHAVLEKTLGIVALNAFDAENTEVVSINSQYTPVKKITVNGTVSVMISTNERGETTVTVSDPTQLCENVTVSIEIEGITSVVSAAEGTVAGVNGGVLTLTAKTLGTYGAGFTVVVK